MVFTRRFINIDEDLEDSAKRILANEANIKNIYLEQLYTFGNPNKDSRMRIVSTCYMALIDKNKLNQKISKNTSWFNVTVLENKKILMQYQIMEMKQLNLKF